MIIMKHTCDYLFFSLYHIIMNSHQLSTTLLINILIPSYIIMTDPSDSCKHGYLLINGKSARHQENRCPIKKREDVVKVMADFHRLGSI